MYECAKKLWGFCQVKKLDNKSQKAECGSCPGQVRAACRAQYPGELSDWNEGTGQVSKIETSSGGALGSKKKLKTTGTK